MNITFNIILTSFLTSTSIVGILIFAFKKVFEKFIDNKFNKDLEKYKTDLNTVKDREVIILKNEVESQFMKEQETFKGELTFEIQKKLSNFQENIHLLNEKELEKLKNDLYIHTEKELEFFKNELAKDNEKQKLLIDKQFEIFSKFVENVYRIRNYFRDWFTKLKEMEIDREIDKEKIVKEFDLFLSSGQNDNLDLLFNDYLRLIEEFKDFKDATFNYRFFLPEIIFGHLHQFLKITKYILSMTSDFLWESQHLNNESIKVELQNYNVSIIKPFNEIDSLYYDITKLLKDYFKVDNNINAT